MIRRPAPAPWRATPMVSHAFTLFLRLLLNPRRPRAGPRYSGVALLDQSLFVVDREAYDGASELLDSFGERALAEAAIRAERSRDVGNHIHVPPSTSATDDVAAIQGASGPSSAAAHTSAVATSPSFRPAFSAASFYKNTARLI